MNGYQTEIDRMNLSPGTMLVATPKLNEDIFDHTVIYLWEYSFESGAKGTVLNKSSGTSIYELTDRMDYNPTISLDSEQLFHGGPVAERSITMLHTPGWYSANTKVIQDQVAISSDTVMIEKITQGNSPDSWRMFAGRAEWQPGQLEKEIDKNYWLTMPGVPDLIWLGSEDSQWAAALDACSQHAVESWF